VNVDDLRNELPELESYPTKGVVYFLICGGEVVYIGSTVDLAKRVSNHRRDMQFDSVLYLGCESTADALNCERFWIKKAKPKHNVLRYRSDFMPPLLKEEKKRFQAILGKEVQRELAQEVLGHPLS
jgi:predicted GIY-YIG superfamily endonuclease